MATGSSLSSSTNLLLAVGCALGLSVRAEASEPADRCQRVPVCRIHSEKGIALSEKKNYGDALNEFLVAYDAEPAPRLLLNIGRSLYRLGRSQEALDSYARYRKVVTSLDREAEEVVKRYELDALAALAVNDQEEPPPAPLRVLPDRWPPRFALGLLGSGLGLLVIGIGLGAGAVNAGKDISQPVNNFTTFGLTEQAIQSRGLNMQASGFALDVLGLFALGVGVSSVGTWAYMKKSGSHVAKAQSPGRSFTLGPSSTRVGLVSLGGL